MFEAWVRGDEELVLEVVGGRVPLTGVVGDVVRGCGFWVDPRFIGGLSDLGYLSVVDVLIFEGWVLAGV